MKHLADLMFCTHCA